ncbi:MAG: FAD-dependent oxidoreductase [Candidatus Promineifilaceae bacterium]
METVIVGGGQAGLAISYHLTQRGHEHAVLEKAHHPGSAWRSRWDSFTLVTPNWQFRMPGAEYEGEDPDGFLSRDEVLAFFENYVERFQLPVRFGVTVNAIWKTDTSYHLLTSEGEFEATNVVIAIGTFQKPKIPACSTNFPPSITQLHSSQYKNAKTLPPGAVLVVGSGQSGCQIAEELYLNGRQVYQCVGSSSGRVPRRYRTKDCMWWLEQVGYFDRPTDAAIARFTANPHVSGARGGHTLNLHQFARDGVILLGHLKGITDSTIRLVADLNISLAKIDKYEADLLAKFDAFAHQNGLDLPPETLPELYDGYQEQEITELNLKTAGITTVIWATGYSADFHWLNLPGLLDRDGFPIQERGVTGAAGLYFLGLHCMHTAKSGLLFGVGGDAVHVADHITRRNRC